MGTISVDFIYYTGLHQPLFSNVRLCGGWDATGSPSEQWSIIDMIEVRGEDGCPAYRARVEFPDTHIGTVYPWGVLYDGPAGKDLWGIVTEVNDQFSTVRHRYFTLTESTGPQRYWLNTSRRLGANKRWDAGAESPRLEFAVWAPNAQQVSVVFGDLDSGYIADDGTGINLQIGRIPMTRGADGVWTTDPAEPRLADFHALVGHPYMFEVVKDDGTTAYRSDLYSRCQIGKGKINPAQLGPGESFSGRYQDLDGTVSCSVVVDPERVSTLFDQQDGPDKQWSSEEEFWADEFDPARPLPSRIDDLVIYEMHVGGLGVEDVDRFGVAPAGDLADAMELIDYLSELGVNAIQLLPIAEFEGVASWGYGISHFFAVEYSGGGRDQLKHFIRACHRKGIAVILDVVYNHYHHFAERAEWMYDSNTPSRNIYYWYEGRESDYPDPTGGYVNNISTGWAPRFWEEQVRQMLISSALVALTEFHIDGFRVDQTTSIHDYATLNADGRRLDNANAFGAKFLRELTRTLRLVKPNVFLIAEDHSGWDAVTKPVDAGGLGFDASWYAEFYHNLAGDTGRLDTANLLTTAGFGDNRPLAMDRFAEVLRESAHHKVVYHESHDEAGNSRFAGGDSGRTVAIAVRDAPLVGETRRYAEARARFAAGMTLLSPGIPMFFMGEEVAATEDYRYDDFIWHRTNLVKAAQGDARHMFTFYQDLIRLRLTHPAVRSHQIDVFHADNTNRVLGIHRPGTDEEILVLASLNDHPFVPGYRFRNAPDGTWREIFNSDAAFYGGWNEGNGGMELTTVDGRLEAVLPRAGFVVLQRV